MEYTYQNLQQVLNRLINKSCIPILYEQLINRINNKNPEDKISEEDYDNYLNLLNKEYVSILKKNNITNERDVLSLDNQALIEMFDSFWLYNNLQQAHLIDGKYTIIPILNKKAYLTELGELFLNTELNLDDYLRIAQFFKKTNNKTIKTLREAPINEYFGEPQFIYDRCLAIEEGLTDLCEKSSHKEELSSVYSKALPLIEQLKNNCLKPDMNQQDYIQLVFTFQKLLEIEEKLRPYVKEEWEKYFQENKAKLFHNLSSKIVESNKMTKICTSIKTENFNTVTFESVGYEYGPNYDQIISICPSDSGSWMIKKEDFITEDGIMTSKQYGNKYNIFYEKGKQTILYLPDRLLEDFRPDSHTEVIFMDPNHVIKPVCAFYTDKAMKSDIDRIKLLAHKQKIPVEYIDTSLINFARKGM